MGNTISHPARMTFPQQQVEKKQRINLMHMEGLMNWQRKSFHEKIANPKLTQTDLDHMLKGKAEDVNAYNPADDDMAAIHIIVTGKHKHKPELLATLVMYNADINLTTGKKGMTALHLAVEANDLEVMKALVALWADFNATTESIGKHTPLDLAHLIAGKKLVPPNEEVQLDNLSRQPVRVQRGTEAMEKGFSESVEVSDIESSEIVDSPTLPVSPSSQMIVELKRVGALSSSVLCCCSPTVTPSKCHRISQETDEHKRRVILPEYKTLDDTISEKLQDSTFKPTPEEALELWEKMRELKMYRKTNGSRILCLDGGGIRGINQIVILRQIEVKTGKKITELFDWIVGTSIGGIIALALVYGKKSVKQLQQFSLKLKEDVFGGSSEGLLGKGNETKLEEALKDWVGADNMDTVKHPKVLISAVSKKKSNLQLHFFNNCLENEYSHEVAWKVGRYTSAAPFYFTEVDGYIDGGLLANNPCEDALTVIQEFYRSKGQKLPISLVVSIGSGMNPPKELGTVDVQTSFNPSKILTLKTLRTWMDFFEVLQSAVLNPTAAKNCQSRCSEQGIEFFRFNPQLDDKVESNETNISKLLHMLWTVRVYMHQEKPQMEKLCELFEQSYLCHTIP